MPRSNDDTDKLIREALEQSDAELLDSLKDPSLVDLLAETFRGRNRRLAIGGAVLNLLLFVAAILGGVQFLRAREVGGMLLGGGVMLLCFGLVAMIKIWYWLEMNRLALTREVKRLELRVARIAERLDAEPAG